MNSDKEVKKDPTVVNNKRNLQVLNKLEKNFRGGRNRVGDVTTARKRVFVPNIPVRREQSKEVSQEQQKCDKPKFNRSERGRGFGRGGREHGRGRGRGDLIQTQGGVFAAGPSAQLVKREYTSRNIDENSVQVPKYTPVSVQTKEEKEEEEEKLKKLLKDDFIGDDYEYDDIKPVKLPLFTQMKCEEESKPDLTKIKIKKEPKDECSDMEIDITDTVIKKEEVKTEEYGDEETTVNDLLTNNNNSESGMFFFFQFPMCPLKDYLDDDKKLNVESKSTTNNSTNKNEENSEDIEIFKDISDGLIGKLLILKSGKVILRVGSMCFNVENGTKTGFLQEIVSLKADEESQDLHVLGYLNNRIICLPDVNSLVANVYI
ncbi:DNA-directed RNA polymerase III subunit RPC4-like [Centruroides sculpturatus]|uniref:DNA-directed RNA polymerase III subunit RPC4-like n=1 Tax=Centruroides sculpturatus TaxID=218467 RepID=UPI000C6DE914|nr:DNA-directed RNA polymerase III subunit RPC4-like [Centruroides sculpturatus]